MKKARKLTRDVPFSNTHRARLEAQELFPRRVKLNPSDPRSQYAYIEEEYDAWVEARAAARDSEEAG